MEYEIDFIQVSKDDSSKSGDAIALRWGDLRNDLRDNNFVVLIDGGFKDSGETVADSIKRYYGTTTIDLVISTHPDADHINGLKYILENFTVTELWMHLPWEHNSDIADKFQDGRVTDHSIGERLKEACEAAWNLYNLAKEKGVEVKEPFSDKNDIEVSSHDGKLRILGPSEKFYEELLPNFDNLPPTKEDSKRSIIRDAAETVKKWITDLWNKDSIDDEGVTSAKNNSSVILEFVYDNKRFLFTADAGIPALMEASELVSTEKLILIQIPHHGSRRNVGPTVLNKLIGPIKGRNDTRDISAIVSCAKNSDEKHPNKRVLNAFTRRGCKCFKISSGFLHSNISRKNWGSATPCEFHDEVEDEE